MFLDFFNVSRFAMKVLIVYVLAVTIFLEFIRAARNPIYNAFYGFVTDPIGPESVSHSFAKVYDENPTMAKAQELMGGSRKDPDEAATCGQLIESRGFGLERHYMTTLDGYILQVHRMINPYARAARKCLKPVLLSHGLIFSFANWLYAGPDGHIKPWVNGNPPNDNSTSLGFLLGNEGYDVWFINVRGTSYSTNHTHLDSYKDPEFWDYSFQDIAIYDVTAVVEYMKKITDQEQITLIGHSQGTIQQFIQIGLMPEFEKNYDLLVLAAPIGFLGNLRGLSGTMPHEPFITNFVDTIKMPLPPKLAYADATMGLFCQIEAHIPICLELMGAIFGTEAPQVNISRIPIIASLFDRTSVRNIVHYLQCMHKDSICYFDHGKDKNIELYGSPEPPNFPFHRINASKLALISGLNDLLATKINDQQLLNSLNDKKNSRIYICKV